MKLLYIPNIITCLRIVLLIPFVLTFITEQYVAAFAIFLLAGISDGIDGYLARFFNWQTKFGSIADPLADKLLLITSFLLLGFNGALAPWVVGILIMRDVIIMWGAGSYYWAFGQIDFEPIALSKVNTVLQVMLIFFLLYGLAFGELFALVSTVLLWCVMATTLITLVDYIWTWSKKAYNNWHNFQV